MNRKVLALGVVIALVATLAIPTVAFSDGGEDDPGPLVLQPHEGPNGEYATVVDEEIAVNFERLSKRSTTTFHDVFSMTATGDEPVEVWIEFDEADVYVDGDPDARIDSEADALTLQPGESADVGFRIDADDAPDADRMTIHATEAGGEEPPTPEPTPVPDPGSGEPRFEVVEVTTAERVTAGEPTEIDVTVENVGDAGGEYTAQLVVDGVVVDSRTVTIPAGERRTVTFERTFENAGTFAVEVDDEGSEVTVDEPDGDAILEVTDVRIEKSSLQVGDSTEIVATVENVGDAHGADAVELTVGDLVVDTKEIAVPAGETREVTFERQFTAAGVYSISVDGVDAGDVVVGSAAGQQFVSEIRMASLPIAVAGLVVVLVLRRRFGIRPFAGR